MLGLANDAEDEVVELGRGLEQQSALQCAGGNFDEGVLGDEAERSRHTNLSVSKQRSCFLPSPFLQTSGTYPGPAHLLRRGRATAQGLLLAIELLEFTGPATKLEDGDFALAALAGHWGIVSQTFCGCNLLKAKWCLFRLCTGVSALW